MIMLVGRLWLISLTLGFQSEFLISDFHTNWPNWIFQQLQMTTVSILSIVFLFIYFLCIGAQVVQCANCEITEWRYVDMTVGSKLQV